jgi:hypothetical protein
LYYILTVTAHELLGEKESENIDVFTVILGKHQPTYE